MKSINKVYVCSKCGREEATKLVQCPRCGEVGSYQIRLDFDPSESSPHSDELTPVPFSQIKDKPLNRITSAVIPFDTALGGGLVKPSSVLISGEPGIGKSTLLCQVASSIGSKGLNVLYVTGEEEPQQVKNRTDRLNLTMSNCYILASGNLKSIRKGIEKVKPDLVIIDSIQTLEDTDYSAKASSMSQVKGCVASLIDISKEQGLCIVFVAHINKEGIIAGPKFSEHMVDTVAYFEGKPRSSRRTIRISKNRFGSCLLSGNFEMTASGLVASR